MTVTDAEQGLTKAEARDLFRTSTFLERVMEGVGPLNAAIEVGWSPAQLDAKMKDPEFADLVAVAEERLLEGLEQVLYEKAQAGHFKALQMVLYNRRSSKWRDVRHISVEKKEQLDPGAVQSVKLAIVEAIKERGAAALQRPPEAIEATSRDSDS